MMNKIDIGLVGFGTIGGGVVGILNENAGLIKKLSGLNINLKYVADIDTVSDRGVSLENTKLINDADVILNDDDIKIVIELVGGTTYAYELVKKALQKGKSVITANKALLAYYGKELFEIAKQNNVYLEFEASVAGGIPIIKTLREALVGDKINSVYGIINGTSNFILTKMMEENKSFDDALKEAQELGFAESDPALDINGGDPAHKIAILTALAFNTFVPQEKIHAEGIDNIDLIDVKYAYELGFVVKLLGIAKEDEDGVDVRVHPKLIPFDNQLASVKYENNAILVNSRYLGETMYFGKGAGRYPTANAIIADLVHVASAIATSCNRNANHYNFEDKRIKSISEATLRYYLRFNTVDEPGVLHTISGILMQENISIAQVIQHDTVFQNKKGEEYVHVVITTHRAKEKNIINALNKINQETEFVRNEPVMIRVFEENE